MKKKNKKNSVIILLLIIATLFMGVGYATMAGVFLEVDGNATVQVSNIIAIDNAVLYSNNNANTQNSIVNSFFNTNLNSTVELNNDSASSITYAVTVFNNSGGSKAYKNTTPPYTNQTDFYTNTGIKYEVTGITNGEVVNNQASKTFYVTFSYTNGVSANKVLNSILAFNFDDYYTITYNNITGVNLPSVVFASDNDLTITATNTLSSISVTGTVGSYNYNSTTGLITITDIESNITITGTSGGGITGSGTEDDPYVDYTVTEYDLDDIEPGTTVQYPLVEGNPIITKDDNGKISSFEFDLDTNESVTLDNGESVETGIIAFDGTGFTIHLKMKTTLPDNVARFYLTALQTRASGTYDGFSLYVANPNKLTAGTYVNKARAGNGRLTANYTSTLATTSTADQIFDITIVYNPTGYNGQPIITIDTVNFSTGKWIRGNTTVPSNLTNATFTLGGNGLDHADDINSMEVLEFSITKNY